MSNKDLLDNIKKLRELTGVGFKDCKLALDESNGDIEKSIEFLRKKGIAKASKKMDRTASEGLSLVNEKDGVISIIEVNSETDFVAKNKDFISFCKELSDLNFSNKGNLEKLNLTKMKNGSTVNDNLINLISKIGEKITIRRANFFDNNKGHNFYYVHSSIEKNIGKIISIVKIDGLEIGKNDDLGMKLSMHIAASNPLALTSDLIDQSIIDKEQELVTEELKNSGKPEDIAKKISLGKMNKFKEENSLLTQAWVMEPKKKVQDVVKELSIADLKIKEFYRIKIGE